MAAFSLQMLPAAPELTSKPQLQTVARFTALTGTGMQWGFQERPTGHPSQVFTVIWLWLIPKALYFGNLVRSVSILRWGDHEDLVPMGDDWEHTPWTALSSHKSVVAKARA